MQLVNPNIYQHSDDVPVDADGKTDNAATENVLPDRALVIHPKWLQLILNGEKTIEIRGKGHNAMGQIYLLEAKTGAVKAIATLHPHRDLTEGEKITNREAIEAMNYQKPVAWPLADIVKLDAPWFISAEARKYCPTWIPRSRWEKLPAEQSLPKEKKAKIVKTDIEEIERADTPKAPSVFSGDAGSSLGGRGHDTMLAYVRQLLDVMDENEVRQQLRAIGKSSSRIWQLMKRVQKEKKGEHQPSQGGRASSSTSKVDELMNASMHELSSTHVC